MGNLLRAIETIHKRFGKGSLVPLSKSKGLKVRRFSTGSLAMDMELGGGYPVGRITEQIGHWSTSKTTTCLAAATEFLAADKEHSVVYVDVENSIDPEWALKVVGEEYADRLLLTNVESGEQAADKVKEIIYSRIPTLVVIDSIASMTPDREIEEDFEKGIMGVHAKFINRFMRVTTSGMYKNLLESRNDCATMLMVNQIREKIGVVFGNPETTPGGKGKEFHSSVRVMFRRAEYIVDDDGETKKKVGIKVAFRITKNKVGPPETGGEYDLYFRPYGPHVPGTIDNVEAAVRYGVLSEVVDAGGRSFRYGKISEVGKEAFCKRLRQYPNILIDLVNETAATLEIHDYAAEKLAWVQKLQKQDAGKGDRIPLWRKKAASKRGH